MPIHAGPVLALAALLVVAGASKLRDPAPTAGALAAAGFPHHRVAVIVLGVVEIGLGTAVIAFGDGYAALAAGAVYGGFAWFVVVALRRRLPIASCGCLGAIDTPPSRVHLVLDLVAVALLVSAWVQPIGPLGGLPGQPPDVVVPFLAFTGVTVYLLYASIAVLPLARPPAPAPSVSLPSPTRRSRRG